MGGEAKRKASGQAPVKSSNGGKCELLIRNGMVFTMDQNRNVYSNGAVAVDGNRIVAVGSDREITARFRADRVVDARGAAVHPGLYDAHAHVSLHTTRGAFPDSPSESEYQGFFTQWMQALSDEDEYASTLLASLEMLHNGVTCFLEPGTVFEPEAAASAAQKIGIRASVTDPYIWDRVAPGYHELDRAPLGFARAERLLGHELRRNSDPDALVRGHLGLYGGATASDELEVAAKQIADQNGAILTQHQSFYIDDVKADDARFGRHALVHFAEIGVLGPNCTFAHMNGIRDDEIAPVVESGLTIAWNPGNYMFYGIGAFFKQRAAELFHKGVSVAPGTDVAKVWGFGEQSFISFLLARGQGQFLSAEDLLEMATLCGARAVGLQGKVGSLEPGMLADIVVRNQESPESQPAANVLRDLTLISRSKSVDTVIVNGKVVLRHGRLTNIEEEVVYNLAGASARRIAEKVGLKDTAKWPIRD